MYKLTFVFLLWATALSAQELPKRENLRVNDFADLLVIEEEARLTRQLDQLAREIGTDMTVLTISTREDYMPTPSIGGFATTVFDTWGIGSAQDNSGILILIAHSDREMRIELGADYGRSYDQITGHVIDQAFLPEFRRGDYANGIEKGVDETIRLIATPFKTGGANEATDGQSPFQAIYGFLLLAGAGAAAFLGRLIYRHRKTCPKCGARTLQRTKVTVMYPNKQAKGLGRKDLYCASCFYKSSSTYSIAALSDTNSWSSSGGGGFSGGGGSSGGGGASGSW